MDTFPGQFGRPAKPQVGSCREAEAPVILPRFVDFYRYTYGPFMRERRLAGMPDVSLLHLRQPAGDLSDKPVAELVLVHDMTGTGPVVLDHGAGRFSHRSRPDDLYVVPAGVATSVLADNPNELLVIALPMQVFEPGMSGAALPSRAVDVGRLAAGPFRNGFMAALLQRLWQAADPAAGFGRLHGETAVALLACELLAEAGRPARIQHGGLAAWQLRRVTGYMRDHLEHDMSLSELAALVGLSAHHFCRAFQASTGAPPHRWLVERRIERAKAMMAATPQVGLTEVALAVGYGSQSAFGAAFRRVTGTAPRAWRRQRMM